MRGGQDRVDNASGQPSANTTVVSKPVVATSAPPGPPPGHRTPVVISGHDGQALGDLSEGALAGVTRHLTIRETVDAAGAHPREQEYLDFIFGRNLPGR